LKYQNNYVERSN